MEAGFDEEERPGLVVEPELEEADWLKKLLVLVGNKEGFGAFCTSFCSAGRLSLIALPLSSFEIRSNKLRAGYWPSLAGFARPCKRGSLEATNELLGVNAGAVSPVFASSWGVEARLPSLILL